VRCHVLGVLVLTAYTHLGMDVLSAASVSNANCDSAQQECSDELGSSNCSVEACVIKACACVQALSRACFAAAARRCASAAQTCCCRPQRSTTAARQRLWRELLNTPHCCQDTTGLKTTQNRTDCDLAWTAALLLQEERRMEETYTDVGTRAGCAVGRLCSV
jgi:hypothetical protein